MKIAKIPESSLTLLRKRARRDKTNALNHLLDCYQTMYENACDPKADVLEFKPEILNAQARITELEAEVEKLKGILTGDPNLTATKEQREQWRLSAVRYADKLETQIVAMTRTIYKAQEAMRDNLKAAAYKNETVLYDALIECETWTKEQQ